MDGVYEVKKINPSCFDKTTEEILSNLEKTKNSFWNLDRECANFLNTLIKIKKRLKRQKQKKKTFRPLCPHPCSDFPSRGS